MDLRGQLPIRVGARPYYARPLDGIDGITIHYTASPPAGTVEQIAAYQTGPDAQEAFPAIAYTMVVESDGAVYLCHDLATRCWHSGAVIGGIARNASHVSICWLGNMSPTKAQCLGMLEAIRWTEQQLGRSLTLEGHRDAPYPTSCPGPTWPAWKAALIP